MSDNNIQLLMEEKSRKINPELKNTAIILAAGHGKRIKSNISKMLHEIWGEPTVVRVAKAVLGAFNNEVNLMIVVGVKAESVLLSVDKKLDAAFAYQEVQNGTGHAVQVALEKFPEGKYEGNVYVLPGDMGLIDSDCLADFKKSFESSEDDMMVLTGTYEGDPSENSYGRILRVPNKDIEGNSPGSDFNKVIEILEYKEILSLSEDENYQAEYGGRKYDFTREELLNNNEFNSGVFVYKYEHLKNFIKQIESNNVQKEIYLTDLISLFNRNELKVGAVSPEYQHVIMGFNNKSVLMEMNNIARNLVYEKLKDVITIDDPNDFFIADSVVEELLKRDSAGEILDIKIGRGVFIGDGIKLGNNIVIGKDVRITGGAIIGNDTVIDCLSIINGSLEIKQGTYIAPFSVVK